MRARMHVRYVCPSVRKTGRQTDSNMYGKQRSLAAERGGLVCGRVLLGLPESHCVLAKYHPAARHLELFVAWDSCAVEMFMHLGYLF